MLEIPWSICLLQKSHFRAQKVRSLDFLHFHTSRWLYFCVGKLRINTLSWITNSGEWEKKGVADKPGVNPTVISCGRLLPIDVTERGSEIVSNWRAVQGLRIPRSSLVALLFLSLSVSRQAVSSRTCRTDPGIVVQIQQKPRPPTSLCPFCLISRTYLRSQHAAAREAAQLIYVVSEAFTRERKRAAAHLLLRIRTRVRHCHNLE